MTARISILPVTRVEHDHEASLREADDLSNVVRIDNFRRKAPRHYLLAEQPYASLDDLGEAFALLWLQGLETAARLATTPLWPGGIDDLKW